MGEKPHFWHRVIFLVCRINVRTDQKSHISEMDMRFKSHEAENATITKTE